MTLKSEILAKFVVETTFESIPTDMVEKAKRHILDSVGAGIAGARSVEVARLMATLDMAGEGSGRAVLWGDDRRRTPLVAALVNGTAAHAFELDDTGGCDHSGAVVVPAVFAALTLVDRVITGKELITAVLLGYDVARRALEACGAYEPHNAAGFHSTGTCGPFGAAAAAGRILGLNVEQMTMALGLASSFSAGLWACVHNGAQNKRLHAGHAAQGGLMSALLAKSGFTGPEQIFEEVWGGFNKSFAPTSSVPEAWTADLGHPWKLHRVSIKPHASCRSTHSSIDAVHDMMRDFHFTADDIEEIEVVINPFVYGMCGAYDRNPMNAAQLSIPYSVAAFLVFGTAQLPSFSRTSREDPRIEPMMKRIKMTVDDTQKDDDEPIVRVTLKDRRLFSLRVPMPLGAPTNPVSDEALLQKFRSVSTMSLSADTVDRLAELFLTLEDVDDASVFLPLLGDTPVTRGTFDA